MLFDLNLATLNVTGYLFLRNDFINKALENEKILCPSLCIANF